MRKTILRTSFPLGLRTPAYSKEEERMSGSEEKRSGLTRRGFLKAAGGVAGSLAVAGAALPSLSALAEGGDGVSSEEIYVGMCRGNCLGGCVYDITVRGGKVAKVMPHEMPDPKYTRCCLKGLSHPVRMYDANRVSIRSSALKVLSAAQASGSESAGTKPLTPLRARGARCGRSTATKQLPFITLARTALN